MISTKDALLEIGSEELPSSFISLGIKQLRTIVQSSLEEHHLPFKTIAVYGTPRRLAVHVAELAAHTQDQEKKLVGPPENIAKDSSGHWTAAALGFARKQGVKPTDLAIENGRLLVVQRIKGMPTRSLLAELFPQWIRALEFPKSMTWEPSHFRFPRPIRWFAAIYGSDLVSFSLAGVRSGRYTYGLMLQSSKKLLISQPAKYSTLLQNQCVLVDPEVRRQSIRKLTEVSARRTHGHVLIKDALLEEVANLVEHPVAILGNFDPAYLDLPSEVLITCLQHHQKFFPVEHAANAKNKKLLPHFVGIRNGLSVHQEIVREGYERVLAARLSDARFFFNQDRRAKLDTKVDALRGVMFQKALGSLFDKKERVKTLITSFAGSLPQSADWLTPALRSAELCKADLVTELVREFPELQGIMARLYALADHEEPAVAQSLEEHYWPITLTSPLPTSDIAAVVALTDKLDTLVGDFSVGLIPSGSADPYGLRRAAVGILRILEARAWPVSIEHLIEMSVATLPESVRTQRPNTGKEVAGFIRQRLSALLEERGFKSDEIEAVLVLGIGVLPQTLARLQALHDVRTRPEIAPLSAAFKRAMNIVRQASQKNEAVPEHVKPELLSDGAEKALFDALAGITSHVSSHIRSHAYAQALDSLASLRSPLDHFFDSVHVMAEDPAVKANRLALLSGMVKLFLTVADFSKLQNV